MRRLERFSVQGSNALWQIYQTVSFFKVLKNTCIILLGRMIPWMAMKRWLYRVFLRMEIGEQTAFAFMVMLDLLYPERIKIGKNTIIGYNTTILTHEYLIDEYRLGHVVIGDQVMIGANTTILPGVTIGDHAVIGAGTVVSKDVEPYQFVVGNPMQIIKKKG
ncbi:Acetyltransferase (isoleucine patch superfamily) [Seinonella peptonophila]|uniref:Acetyltransferase (Isoleucine patch superfamily) n=1 Tax=Seinonella peptonophila TaxID=112248 RepID=A0A1M4XPF7_9BACL|nr:acyltransferase [Seinonella peptonophila]SHE95153.1 Acetyltransferase (isoleucine patch superfamily) [Seinonella peptonophila]